MRWLIALGLCAPIASALAQTAEPLPGTLSGRWTWMSPSGAIIDSFSLVLEGDRGAATIPGRLTWRGVNCGAKDEPVQVAWNGSELRFESFMKPNVNTQRMNGQCPSTPAQFVLKRRAGSASFEGEARAGNVVITMTASP